MLHATVRVDLTSIDVVQIDDKFKTKSHNYFLINEFFIKTPNKFWFSRAQNMLKSANYEAIHVILHDN